MNMIIFAYMKKHFLLLALAAAFVACKTPATPDPGTDGPEGTKLTLEVDHKVIKNDGVSCANLIVKLDGQELKSGVTFYDDKNKTVPVQDFKFSTKQTGEYKIWASYKSLYTQTVTIYAINNDVPEIPADPKPEAKNFKRRSLVLQFTGTGCGYCPYVIELLREFASDKTNEGKYVHVACHTYNPKSDPCAPNEASRALPGVCGVSGYPDGCFNVDTGFKFNANTSTAKFQSEFEKSLTKKETVTGLSAKCVSSVDCVVANCAVKVSKDGKYKLAAWLLEDNIKANQASYGPTGDYSTHENCLRSYYDESMKNDYAGKTLELSAGDTGEYCFVLKLDESWKSQNMHVAVVVFAADAQGKYTVNNIIDCPINSSVPFEYTE